MERFAGKQKFDSLTLAQLHSAPPPAWCMRIVDRKLEIDNSGVIPCTLHSKSFFGPDLESWFLTLLAKTHAAAERGRKNYPFLLQQYINLLAGLRDILTAGWDVWQNCEAGKPRTLTHNPFASNDWDMLSIHFLCGSLAFLKKAAQQHNRLLATAGVAAAPWDPGFLDFTVACDHVSRGVLEKTRSTVTIRATPAVLGREMDRLSGRGSGPAIPDA